jgi:hypothetical protein
MLILLNSLSPAYMTVTSISTDKHSNQTSSFLDPNASAIVQSLGRSQFTKLQPITNESDLLRPDRVIHPPLLPPNSLR